MKVTRNTSEQLILADTPWLIGIMLAFLILVFVGVGLMFVLEGHWQGLFFVVMGGGIGGIAFAVFVRRVQVILDRPSDSVRIRSRSVFGYREVRHALSNLDRAVLETTSSSKGGTLYRPTLVFGDGMDRGRHPIVESYTNTGGPKRLVDAVNDWLGVA